MSNVKPISPVEAENGHRGTIPDSIIKAFNTLITKNYEPINKKSVVKQCEVLAMVCGDHDCGMLTEDEVFDNHWLDIEDIYREQGWKVKYDEPCYNESFEPYFEFSVKK